MTKVPSVALISSLQPRAVLIFLLVAGALMLALSSAVQRPTEEAEAATAAGGAHGTEATGEQTSETSVVSDEGELPSEAPAGEGAETQDGIAAEDDEAADEPTAASHAVATPAAAAASEDDPTASLFGIDLNGLNLAFPRFSVLAIALTIVSALAYALLPSTRLLLLVAGASVVGVAANVREALHSGEELGIFVPLPVLAAVLYGGAGVLAGLQFIGDRGRSRRPVAAVHHGATHEA